MNSPDGSKYPFYFVLRQAQDDKIKRYCVQQEGSTYGKLSVMLLKKKPAVMTGVV